MTSYTFNNANGGYWENAPNWSPSGVPGAADSATDDGLQLAVDQTEAAATLMLAGSATLDIYGAKLTIAQTLTMTDTPTLTIHDGTLELDGKQSATQAAQVTFANDGDGSSTDLSSLDLKSADSQTVDNPTVLHFAAHDAIDLLQMAFTTGATAVLSGDVLDITLTSGANSPTVEIMMDQTVMGDSFIVSSDGNGGSLVQVACFCPGTAIATPDGDVPVERLKEGDLVMTADGPAAIRWIGRRSYAGRFLLNAPGLNPVRIAACSLGDGLPRRDLFVSAQHAMLLDGVLVAAGDLVNGDTVIRQHGRRQVDYLHVELDRHAILFAEGAATESFIDDGSAGLFSNAHERPQRNGLAPDVDCAPRVTSGPQLQEIRSRLSGCLLAA